MTAALKIVLSPAEQKRINIKPTDSLQAYESYLLGRVAWAKRTPKDFSEAIVHLHRATELDPTFGLAYSALADVYALQPFFSAEYDSDFALAQTEELAKRALSLDPSLGQAHTTLGLVREFRFDWAGAEEQFLLAIDKTPEHATAHHWYANLLSRRGRFVEGMAHIRKAHELDPLSLIVNQDVGYNLHLSGQNEAALRQYERTLLLDPDYPVTTLVYAWELLVGNQFDEARTALERWAVQTGRNPAVLGRLVDAARPHQQTSIPQELPEGIDIEGDFPPYFAPLIYLSIGKSAQAIDILEQALNEGQFSALLGLSSPYYDVVRQDPRFVAVAHKVGIGLDLQKM